jgi:abortive infection bacteriophage resistance protein
MESKRTPGGLLFYKMSMTSMPQPARTYDDQVELLTSRGLQINDEAEAKRALSHLNYYRLQLYAEPFFSDKNTKLFKEGTTFSQIHELYLFDQKLRNLVLAASKLIEVSVRSRLAYVIGHKIGPTGYLDVSNYKRHAQAIETLGSMIAEIKRSKESFLTQYIADDTGINVLPIWIAVEAISFGCASKIFGNLKDHQLQLEVADTYDLSEKVLVPGLHHLNIARNTAAHHGRFWNHSIQQRLRAPNQESDALRLSLENVSAAPGCYNTLVLICYLVGKIAPCAELIKEIKGHLQLLPYDLHAQAGIPNDWKNRPVWNNC